MNAPTTITPNPILLREAVIVSPRVEAGKPPGAIIRASTGADVTRTDWLSGETYIERLAISEAAVDLSFLSSGQAPLLADHDGNTAAVLGTITRAWIEGASLMAEVIGPTPGTATRLDETWSLIKQGILKNVSIGYRVTETRETREAGKMVRTATRWTPFEVSMVALGADPSAKVVAARSAFQQKEQKVNQETQIDTGSVQAAERARAAEILKIARTTKMPETVTASAIDGGMTLEAFRARALDHMAAEQEKTPISNVTTYGSHNATSLDDPNNALRAAGTALLRRNLGLALKGNEQAFAGIMPSGFARMYLEAKGERVGRFDSAAKIVQRAYHTTSDFPLLLGAASQTVLADLLALYDGGISAIATTMTVPDFKTITEVRTGSFPSLEEVGEAGEIKFGTMGETGESIAVRSYARAISISFQALVNDSLGGFDRALRDVAVGAMELKSNLLISALNSTMRDGVTVFHADHDNYDADGDVPTLATLSAARVAMRSQTALGSTTPLGIAPRYLMVPASLETAAQQLAANLNPSVVDEANPFAGFIVPVIEPRLTGDAWYTAADPAMFPALKLAYLEGFDMPAVETEAAFNTLGTSFRVHWHLGAFVTDHRPLYKNSGVTITA